jgi:uncharacterized protein (DUF169 family)
MPDLKAISEVLVKKGKVRGKPVAISLFKDTPPPAYEPICEEPCTIVRQAMDEGKAVYFDANHHDCLVGVYHCGMAPGKPEIMSGEYLSSTSSFFTYEGAARLKSGMVNLPPGLVKAIGAAPLDAVPEGVHVDWIIAVANPHNANQIAGCRVVQDGFVAYGAFGTSLCGDIFSTPWHKKNVIITFGDFGGRMNNRIKQDQLFVVIPIEFADCIPALFNDMRIDVNANLAFTKPEGSPFWNKKGVKSEDYVKQAENPDAQPQQHLYTMDWDDQAKDLVGKAPEGMAEFIIENSEGYAREKGYEKVSRKSIAEQMEAMGMDLDEMLADM